MAGCHTAMDLWDDEACRTLAARHVQQAREAGALTMLPFALNYVAAHHIFAGEFTAAADLLDEADTITAATGNVRMADFSLLLAAWRGRASGEFEAGCRMRLPEARGWRWPAPSSRPPCSTTAWPVPGRAQRRATGLHARRARLRRLGPARADRGSGTNRENEAAAVALHQLSERTSLSASQWAHGIEARSRAS